MPVASTALVYVLAALAEIGGCFAFWAWLRLGQSPLWVLAGMALLAGFAFLLTLAPAGAAGRAYAAYGGVYVASSLLWLTVVERQLPDRWDLTGGLIVLGGAAVILFGPRS